MTAATTALPAPGTPPGKSLFPLRKRTGTAAFHLSAQAVDFGAENLERLSERQAAMLLAELSWGSTTEMPCPHCGTFDAHYFYARELRWKCKCCDKKFSVTSNTVLASHKLPLVKILKIAYNWANGASGKPALQLRRDWRVSYPTVFTLLHKLREGLLRGFNVGVLCGVQEMDGMDVNGRRYREKRNKPQAGGSGPKPSVPAHLLKPKVDPETGEIFGPPKPPKWDKASRQTADRRILLVIRQRGVAKGKGAVATRIAVARSENTRTVTDVALRHASVESVICSDEDHAYGAFGRLFAGHKSVAHSRTYSGPDGANNNQAESFNWRVRRAVEGIYLNISNKYLKDYAAEQAWREDTRRLSTGARLRHLFQSVLRVGPSLFWRGYLQGRHREVELLVEGHSPAPARGRPKRWKPRPPR